MIALDRTRTPADLLPRINRLFEISAGKIRSLERSWPAPNEPSASRVEGLAPSERQRVEGAQSHGAPVFTVEGRYTARGWTEWTEGFQYGSALLQFDATGEREFLELGRERTLTRMAPHLTHMGVHDHGFNNVSTYGALWRMAREGKIDAREWEIRFYELALKISGAVQAHRWTTIKDGGYIHSFNGAHSLFVDTIRSLRVLALAHHLGHRLIEEQDAQVNLLSRLLQHAKATSTYNVFRGTSGSPYDVRGRVAHESLFNVANGTYRGPSTQQGYSPFTTWTRGLAWAMLGFAEELEFLSMLPAASVSELDAGNGIDWMLDAARATCDFYIDAAACADGIPYWDTGAPGLSSLGDWQSRPADPFNDREPVDSSAAAIASQGLLRLGRYLDTRGQDGTRYWQAGLRVVETLFDPAGPYLSQAENHQGLVLHSVYHWPNGWDHVPRGARVPRGESSQWGDYHAREVALYLLRIATDQPYLTFFGPSLPHA